MVDQKNIKIAEHGENYGSWMSMPVFYIFGGIAVLALILSLVFQNILHVIFLIVFIVLAVLLVWAAYVRYAYSYTGGKLMDKTQQYLLEHLDFDGSGNLLEVGCGSAPLSIRAARTWPAAHITGIDNWGKMWDYSKALCEQNATSEGVANQCTFMRGDAAKLEFEDEHFDAVISNLVYHNIVGVPTQDLLMESLRVLKKGGVFAIQDSMKPAMYGDMNEFMKKLKDAGYERVELIDSGTEVFGSQAKGAMMFLGNMKLLVGKK